MRCKQQCGQRSAIAVCDLLMLQLKKKKGTYLRSDDGGLTDTTESGDKKRRGRLTHLTERRGNPVKYL